MLKRILPILLLLVIGTAVSSYANDQGKWTAPPPPAPAQQDYSPPRADQLLMVMLYTAHCHEYCDKVRPILADIAPTFSGKLKYIELDCTAGDAQRKAREVGRALGIEKFIAEGSESAPIVLFFSGASRKYLDELQGAKTKDTYERRIGKLLTKV